MIADISEDLSFSKLVALVFYKFKKVIAQSPSEPVNRYCFNQRLTRQAESAVNEGTTSDTNTSPAGLTQSSSEVTVTVTEEPRSSLVEFWDGGEESPFGQCSERA